MGVSMIIDEYLHPDWGNKEKVHNWRNYASNELQGAWEGFSTDQRKVIAECLQDIADREEWS